MRIIFARHAEKERENENTKITKKGRQQSKYLGKFLKKEKIDSFYCSNLLRVKETSKIVSKEIRKKPIINKFLNEFGMHLLKNKSEKFGKDEKKHFDGLKKFLDKITENKNDEKTILIISHGYTNRVILSHFMKLNHKKLIPFMQHETGINEIYWNKSYKNWRLEKWNDIEHLPKNLR